MKDRAEFNDVKSWFSRKSNKADKLLDRCTKKTNKRRFKLVKSGMKEGHHHRPYRN